MTYWLFKIISITGWSKGWDYIGAPIFEGYGNSNSYSFKTSLNGGFSLRDVEASIKVLKSIKFRYSTFADLVTMEKKVFLKLVRILRDGLIFNYNISPLRTRLNEDLYWAYITPRMHPWFSVPSPDVAQYFAFDKHPKWLFQRNGETLPTAVHAWQRYDPEFAVSLLNRLNENENVKLPEK